MGQQLPTREPAGKLTLRKPKGTRGKITGFMHFRNPAPRVAPLAPSKLRQ